MRVVLWNDSLNVFHALASGLIEIIIIVKNKDMNNTSVSIHTTYWIYKIFCRWFQKYITIRLNAITTKPISTITLEYKKKYNSERLLSHVPEPKGLYILINIDAYMDVKTIIFTIFAFLKKYSGSSLVSIFFSFILPFFGGKSTSAKIWFISFTA